MSHYFIECLRAMASLDPTDPTNPDDHSDHRRDRRGCLKEEGTSDDDPELSPDTEENVTEQTDEIFRNFVYHLYTLHRSSPDSDPDSPRLHEFTTFRDAPPTTYVHQEPGADPAPCLVEGGKVF